MNKRAKNTRAIEKIKKKKLTSKIRKHIKNNTMSLSEFAQAPVDEKKDLEVELKPYTQEEAKQKRRGRRKEIDPVIDEVAPDLSEEEKLKVKKQIESLKVLKRNSKSEDAKCKRESKARIKSIAQKIIEEVDKRRNSNPEKKAKPEKTKIFSETLTEKTPTKEKKPRRYVTIK